ncbi:hypothetical protein [Pseudomonas sp. LFM046]|uniref:hypothetical protein n=1 Tax=Pseudomonas sp. LFM046 TaxID=1608357 RepID=UPI0005CFB27D|nr:hypothetical protein [Pseudomonas sp. LFM046]
MGNRVSSALVTACAALIAGCAGITVTKAPSLDSTAQMQGAPWNMAMTRFTVTITRHITQCGPTIKGKVETLASASTVADPEQRFLLTSNGWFATSDIKSTLSTGGYNTALNAETADATAAVIGNVIGTAAQIAIAFAAAGAAGQKPAVVGPSEICSAALKTAVDTLYPAGGTPLKKTVDEATATLAQKTADVAVLSAQASANKGDKDLKKKLVKALGEQETARIDLEKFQSDFAGAVKASTNIQTVTWPDKSSEFHTSKPFSINQSVLDKWLVTGVDGPNATKQLGVHLALYTQPVGGNWNAPPVATDANVKLGLPVRLPRTAMLAMCTGKPCPASFTAGQSLAESQTVAEFAVLQVGPAYALPISGGAFRSESAAITLDANGAPTVLQTTQKVAAASALTGATKDAATQVAALPAGLRAAELAKTKAEIDQANADIALQTAKQTAGLQGQTGTLNAQTALINAQVANSAAQQNASIQGFQQQAGSLNAQASVMQAQAVLATAQANSQVVDQTSALGAQTTLINAQTALLNAMNAKVKAQTQSLP